MSAPPAALTPGLCSVTFRDASVEDVAALAAVVGAEVLEWGGDVHVPEGDLAAARSAARRTDEAGLRVASYGSYLVLDRHADDRIAAVLDTTLALGAPALRVWCPPVTDPPSGPETGDGSGDATVSWVELVDVAAAVVDAAAGVGVSVYTEFHGGSATSSARVCVELLDGVPGLWSGWQQPYWSPRSLPSELEDLAALTGRLLHVDVYDWDATGARHPLARSVDDWSERLRAAAVAAAPARAAGLEPAALVEFVPGDDPRALAAELASLRSALAG